MAEHGSCDSRVLRFTLHALFVAKHLIEIMERGDIFLTWTPSHFGEVDKERQLAKARRQMLVTDEML